MDLSPVDVLLSRLDNPKGKFPSWVARCPAHDDRSPSLHITAKEDGRVLIHCFAGCEPSDILVAVGLSLSDLYPKAIGDLDNVKFSERPSEGVRFISDSMFGKPKTREPMYDELVPASLFAHALADDIAGLGPASDGLHLPWSKTHGKISLRPGELSVWAGINGHGKSLLLNHVVLQAVKHGQTCVIASMEMPPRTTIFRLAIQAAGSPNPTDVWQKRFIRWTDSRVWLYVRRKGVTPDRICQLLDFCSSRLESGGEQVVVSHFVVDSLMKCGIAPDDYPAQKRFVDRLCNAAYDTGIHVHLVAHARKGESEKRGSPEKWDIKGTSEISDQADNVFIVYRNKRKEEEARKPHPDPEVMSRPDAFLTCDKQRHKPWEGSIGLWFRPECQQFVGYDGAPPMVFLE